MDIYNYFCSKIIVPEMIATWLIVFSRLYFCSLYPAFEICRYFWNYRFIVASAEWSFSKQKITIIETRLWNSMSRIRLSSLALLSIECRRLDDINANTKVRKKLTSDANSFTVSSFIEWIIIHLMKIETVKVDKSLTVWTLCKLMMKLSSPRLAY